MIPAHSEPSIMDTPAGGNVLWTGVPQALACTIPPEGGATSAPQALACAIAPEADCQTSNIRNRLWCTGQLPLTKTAFAVSMTFKSDQYLH